MNFHFTEDQLMLQQAVRDFVNQEVAPNAAKWDEEDYVPVELMPVMGELGFLGIFVPEQYGGVGLGHVERVMIIEEIARHSTGLAMMIFTHQLGMGAILDFGSEEQKMKWLPGCCAGTTIAGLGTTEPGGGSDINGQKCTGVKDGDSWVLNGRKCFITNNVCADLAILTFKTGEDEKGRGIFTAIAIDTKTEGFSAGRHENKLGLRASYTGDISMVNVRVPLENTIGQEGKGNVAALKEIGEIGRASMSAICVGILRGCVEESVKFANERIIYGKPLAKLPVTQFRIGQTRIDYEAARLLLYRAACVKDEGIPATPYYGMSKYFATERAVEAAKRTADLMGAYGIINEYPIGRFLRDAVVSIPSGGTSDVQLLVVAGDTMANFK